jgi:hypothetical protein
MYKTAYFEGERLDHALNVYVILPNAEKAPITPSNLNIGSWLFLEHVVMPIRNASRMARTIRRGPATLVA